MSELTPSQQQEQIKQAFEQAFDAAQGSEMPSGIDQHGKPSIEWVGYHNTPTLQRSEQASGGDQVVAVSNKHGNVEGQHTMSLYEARYNEANSESPERASVRVSRMDSQGNKYTHEFKKPETAAKFVKLIGKHSAARAAATQIDQKAA